MSCDCVSDLRALIRTFLIGPEWFDGQEREIEAEMWRRWPTRVISDKHFRMHLGIQGRIAQHPCAKMSADGDDGS